MPSGQHSLLKRAAHPASGLRTCVVQWNLLTIDNTVTHSGVPVKFSAASSNSYHLWPGPFQPSLATNLGTSKEDALSLTLLSNLLWLADSLEEASERWSVHLAGDHAAALWDPTPTGSLACTIFQGPRSFTLGPIQPSQAPLCQQVCP